MITNRKPPQITSEALAAWRTGNRWALHRALNLRPWDVSPLDAKGERPRVPPEAFLGRVMGGLIPQGVALSQTRGDAH